MAKDHGNIEKMAHRLMYAVKTDNSKEALRLLNNGADPNVTDPYNKTSPLLIAIYYGNTGMVKLLLDHGADANHKNNAGVAPLHMAVAKRKVQIVKLLLDHNADVNVNDGKYGYSPLLTAAGLGCCDMVKLLLAHDADLHHKSEKGDTAIYLAQKRGHKNVVKLLLDRDPTILISSKLLETMATVILSCCGKEEKAKVD